jgi:hypothetical protein
VGLFAALLPGTIALAQPKGPRAQKSTGPALEAQTQELERRLTQWYESAKVVHAELGAISHRLAFFSTYPGWPDMQQILKAFPPHRQTEDDRQTAQQRTAALEQWSQLWQAKELHLETRMHGPSGPITRRLSPALLPTRTMSGAAIYEESDQLYQRLVEARAAFQAIEKDYQAVKTLHTQWVLQRMQVGGGWTGHALPYMPLMQSSEELWLQLQNT